MPITAPDTSSIEDALRKKAEDDLNAIVYQLYAVGHDGVNYIRENHVYQDQSTNLTSSVGCAVVVDGAIVSVSDFEPVKPSGEEGSRMGRSYIESLAPQFPEGITLIMVAGMNYAAYVERRGIGGMTGGEIFVRQAVQDLLEDLKKQ